MARLGRTHRSTDRTDNPSTSSAVAKFAIGGMVALAAVGVGSYFLMRHIGTTEAIDNSKTVTRIVGRQIVEPELTDGILRERPSSIMRLDRVVENRVLSNEIVRVKVWTAGGRIVYSDKNRLIGSRYPLAADDLEVLHSGGVDAGVTDLSQPENRFERSQGNVLEVYLGVHAPNGRPLLFETYQRFSSIASSGSSIWKAFAPAIIGALLILALLQLPLASSMARRLRRVRGRRLRPEVVPAPDHPSGPRAGPGVRHRPHARGDAAPDPVPEPDRPEPAEAGPTQLTLDLRASERIRRPNRVKSRQNTFFRAPFPGRCGEDRDLAVRTLRPGRTP